VSEARGRVNDAAFRTKSKRWLAHTSEFVAPLLRTGATLASRGATSEPSAWRRGLILAHNHMGDALYRTCSLQQLAEALPECRWSYLTSPFSAPLLAGNPAIAEVLPWNAGENSWELTDGAFGDLRRREFDVVLCTNTLRHYPDLALAVALGIPNRVGFAYKGLSGLITRAAPINFPSQYAAYFRGLVADVANSDGDWPLQPHVFPDNNNIGTATAVWREFGFDDTGAVVACSLTTRQASGNWPASHLLAALESAHTRADFEVVLCGAAGDTAELETAARQLSFPVRVLAGRLGLPAYAAFLARCSALLTLDSGPRHLGNAARIPVLFARNLAHSRIEAGKYCDSEIDLAPAVEYLSDEEARRVVSRLPVEDTANALVNALAVAKPSSAERRNG
jgi:heptosyltransferase II